MPITKANLDDVVEADLQELIDSAVPESLTLEFKRDMYAGNEAGRKEFLKDLSSFTNSSGGHLILGMDEDQGYASAIAAIKGNPDQTIQWLNNLAQTAIQPRAMGIAIRAVPVAGGGQVFIIRVPQSWNPPHRVSFQGTNRFYVRSSAGAHEADVEELRALFANGAGINHRIETFINERLEKIGDNEGIVPLSMDATAQGRLIVHILPFSAFAGGGQVDVRAAQGASNLLQTLGSTGTSRVNFEGFLTFRTGEVCHGYTQLFRNGAIEATKVRLVATNEAIARIPSRSFIEPLYRRVPQYFRALETLAVPPPFAISISLLGVHGAILGIGDDLAEQYPLDRHSFKLPIQIIPAFGDDVYYRSALSPAVDALWNAVGFPTAEDFLANYNAEGEWAPNG